jgi:hypothetical protein
MHQKKLQSKFFIKFFLKLCLLIFWVSIVFAQSEGEKAQAPTEDHDSKELNTLIKNYNVDTEKVLKDTSKLNQDPATEVVTDADIEEMRPSTSILEEAKNAALKKVKADLKKKEAEATAASEKGDFSLSVRLALEPLQSLTEEELKQRFTEVLKDSPARQYFENFPQITTLTVKLIKDKESIPSIVKIASDRDRLIHFVSIMLLTILFGYFLKKLFHKEGRSLLGAVFFFILRVIILFGVRIYIIYYFFHVELTPAAKIFQQTFFP